MSKLMLKRATKAAVTSSPVAFVLFLTCDVVRASEPPMANLPQTEVQAQSESVETAPVSDLIRPPVQRESNLLRFAQGIQEPPSGAASGGGIAAPEEEESQGPAKGRRVIAGGGSISFNGGTTYEINAQYGVFTTPRLQLGGGLSLSRSGGSTDIGLTFSPKYHFARGGPQRVIPYVGADLGIRRSSGGGFNSTDFTYGGSVGFDYFVKPLQAVFAEAQYSKINGTPGSDKRIVFGLRVFLP